MEITNDFLVGLTIGIVMIMLVAGRIIHRVNATLRTLHHECGMAAEAIKYCKHSTFERLKGVMSYAEKRHGGLRFVESHNKPRHFWRDFFLWRDDI